MIFNNIFGYEAKRKRLLKRAPTGPLHDFLSVPFPDEKQLFIDTPILSVDFETTGLHAKNDKLLSVGFVDLFANTIPLKSSYHQIVRSKGRLKSDNVTIHQITDSQKNQGEPLRVAIEALLKALTGKVMLVHFARIEREFLQQACINLYGMAPMFPMIDTLMVAKKRLDNRDVAYDPSTLRLSALRQRYNLPEHHAHNALNDAIATAELLMAQVNAMASSNKVTLSDLLL
ncbi:exonuclease domain-containing protein [Colwellia sp. UCD-KL20]|uniref:exonuclease domain-containing protein n=1 Tax=Colwellia sp. UCD-KL20 TaxID=1917165 RepID=UPI00097143D6|nr:exonuclease domain-containing protein [Colwellia sp. UCD-KL20]